MNGMLWNSQRDSANYEDGLNLGEWHVDIFNKLVEDRVSGLELPNIFTCEKCLI